MRAALVFGCLLITIGLAQIGGREDIFAGGQGTLIGILIVTFFIMDMIELAQKGK